MNVISQFKESRFAKNVSALIAGNLSAQLISIISLPILTRLFTASDFGLFATVTSVIAILGTVASLRYELAIPLPFSNKKAFNLLVISIIALVIIIFLLSCLMLTIGLFPEKPGVLTELNLLSWFVIIGVTLLGANNILSYCVIRSGTVNLLAKSLFISEIVKFPVQIMLVQVQQGAVGLILATLIGSFVSLVYLIRTSTIKAFNHYDFVTKRSLKNIAVEYSNFPKYSTLTGFVNVAGQHLPNILIMYFYGAVEAGFLFFANKLLNTLNSISGVAIRQSFLVEAIEQNRQEKLYEEVRRAVTILTIFLILPIITVVAFGKEIVVILFGNDWEMSGEIISILMVIIAAQFITSPVSQVFAIKNKIRESLFLQIILTVLKLMGVVIGYYAYDSFIVSVSLYSIFGAMGYLVFLKKVFEYSKIND